MLRDRGHAPMTDAGWAINLLARAVLALNQDFKRRVVSEVMTDVGRLADTPTRRPGESDAAFNERVLDWSARQKERARIARRIHGLLGVADQDQDVDALVDLVALRLRNAADEVSGAKRSAAEEQHRIAARLVCLFEPGEVPTMAPIDDLIDRVRKARETDRAALAEARDDVRWERARWDRLQPVIRALHAWEAHDHEDADGLDGKTMTLLDEFDAWQKSEAAALNEEDGGDSQPTTHHRAGGLPRDGVPCDGQHAAPPCLDSQCWRREKPAEVTAPGKMSATCHPPSHPTSLGDVWTGETALTAAQIAEISKERSYVSYDGLPPSAPRRPDRPAGIFGDKMPADPTTASIEAGNRERAFLEFHRIRAECLTEAVLQILPNGCKLDADSIAAAIGAYKAKHEALLATLRELGGAP